MRSYLTHLECSNCAATFPADRLITTCPACAKVLYARYDLAAAAREMTPEALASRPWNLWRYAGILPVVDPVHRLTIGEGGTPLLEAPALGNAFGLDRLLVKDEGQNPTGSFKARGLGMAVSRAKELGANALAIPSAGNAASAMAAYAARAGIPAYVFMPADTPAVMKAECRAYGAHVFLVDGLINDAGKVAREAGPHFDWFDVSTLKEPYRAEGKKTMGIELVEQLGWRVPDAIVYPTGGGTGIVGMWKAFAELEEMGLIGPRRPKMIVVQAEGCAPIVRAYEAGERHAGLWDHASTVAAGLRVPVAIGDYLILDAIRESGGTALTVSDAELMEGVDLAAVHEGLFVSPEAGAAYVATRRLCESGFLERDDEVVIFSTGSGMKHTELIPTGSDAFPILNPNASAPDLAAAISTV
ncbi:MAG: Threonine synthase [uncultured Thermomicrobiales bacterium]|uniref:Threonine synthase n=1 Tax=uncultured Thermomicrobiales bacterium TaxID=1645740 RepID=A0A6J4V0Z7_9BACT|nr:MAG: Threonine synthase [uncultured Thermomicrobiales bacterium]